MERYGLMVSFGQNPLAGSAIGAYAEESPLPSVAARYYPARRGSARTAEERRSLIPNRTRPHWRRT